MFLKPNPYLARRSLISMATAAALFAGLAGGIANAGEIVSGNLDTFKQAVVQGRSIIIHVHAAWCPVCAKQNPIVESLMKEPEFKDFIVFKMDFDAQKKGVEHLGVKTQSTFIANKGVNEIDRAVGITDIEQIRQFFRKAL